MTTNSKDSSIIFLSVFKSGTVLMRRIIEDLTSLPWIEPDIIPGKVNYQDPNQLFHKDGYFYSWHLFPHEEVRGRLHKMNAKPILLMRNIYDLVVSMYYHFANNTDADIGRGRNVDHYFQEMSRTEGITCIIKGMQRPDFRWLGIGPHLQQMEQMLILAGEIPSFVSTFERVTSDKESEIKRLANFLDIPLDNSHIQRIVQESSFDHMKEKATAKKKGSHFRQGKTGSHKKELSTKQITMITNELAPFAPNLVRLVHKADLLEVISGGELDT